MIPIVGVARVVGVGAGVVAVAGGLKVGEGKILVAVAGSAVGIAGRVRVSSTPAAPEQPNVASVSKHKTKTLTRISIPSCLEHVNLCPLAEYTHPIS